MAKRGLILLVSSLMISNFLGCGGIDENKIFSIREITSKEKDYINKKFVNKSINVRGYPSFCVIGEDRQNGGTFIAVNLNEKQDECSPGSWFACYRNAQTTQKCVEMSKAIRKEMNDGDNEEIILNVLYHSSVNAEINNATVEGKIYSFEKLKPKHF